MKAGQQPRRASVYIDGFNLYHGCFDNKKDRSSWRQYRWLNVDALCQNYCDGHVFHRIRYFTAGVEAKIGQTHPNNRQRQFIYWRALRTIPGLTIHEGKFAVNAKERLLADRNAPKPTPRQPLRYEYVLEREEKGSDVNLASYLLLDAFKQEYDLAIVESNDYDLAEPIRLVRSEFGVKVCIVNPRNTLARGLRGIADDYANIRFGHIQNAQFPARMSDARGTFYKPDRWA